MIRKAAGIAALVIFGVVAALLIAEVGVRVANRWFPYFYQYDAARGWGLRPNTSGYYSREGASWMHINSYGFRGPNFSKRKPPNTIRIAFIGDSYTEGMQVPYKDTFSQVAARELAQCPLLHGKHVQGMDFGVDGYGTAQELVTLRKQAWAFHPDIVVLAVFLGNDIRNNSVTLEGDQCRPFYLIENGKLMPAGPFRSSNSFRLWCMTRFNYRKQGLFTLLGDAWTIIVDHDEEPTPKYPIERAINYNIYKPPVDKAWKMAWKVTDALIERMHRNVARHHAMFLVATLDTSIQIWPNAGVRDRFMKRIGVTNLFYPDEQIAALGERDGFNVLTLAQPLYKYAKEHHAYLHGFFNTPQGFGHWNKIGHRVAGELMAKRMCEMIKEGQCPSCLAGTTASAGAPSATGGAGAGDAQKAAAQPTP